MRHAASQGVYIVEGYCPFKGEYFSCRLSSRGSKAKEDGQVWGTYLWPAKLPESPADLFIATGSDDDGTPGIDGRGQSVRSRHTA